MKTDQKTNPGTVYMDPDDIDPRTVPVLRTWLQGWSCFEDPSLIMEWNDERAEPWPKTRRANTKRKG